MTDVGLDGIPFIVKVVFHSTGLVKQGNDPITLCPPTINLDLEQKERKLTGNGSRAPST